ncbi:MAG TPA: NAD(P)-binding domain-containing protein, partial [Candidatus Binatia bacterium]|nr:NAD(P)-binding domain-containing protein [Candidatus Binatia bacterium]
LVVGGGSAGLSVSHELAGHGIEHLILERGRIAETWRTRWDSFCLVTPNWSVRMPGGEYDGPDPDGYLPRDEIVAHMEGYARRSGAPVREGVEVRTIDRPADGQGFVARTSAGDIGADRVVLATGTYRRPHRPAGAATLPPDLLAIDVEGYRNPGVLPPGRVLVIGSGQSGCQLAEELHEAGRDVVLSCGRAPWVTRRLDGRDIVWWSEISGFLDQGVSTLPSPMARLGANILATGHGGGHDLHLRTLRAMGVTLVGHFVGAEARTALFAADLGATVAWGDDRYRDFRELLVRTAAERGMPRPSMPEPEPFDPAAPERVPLDGFGAAIFTGGFRPDFASWLPWHDAFDDMGFPFQVDGASTVIPGLYFVGLHFQRKRKSSILLGVGEDAGIVAQSIAGAGAGAR